MHRGYCITNLHLPVICIRSSRLQAGTSHSTWTVEFWLTVCNQSLHIHNKFLDYRYEPSIVQSPCMLNYYLETHAVHSQLVLCYRYEPLTVYFHHYCWLKMYCIVHSQWMLCYGNEHPKVPIPWIWGSRHMSLEHMQNECCIKPRDHRRTCTIGPGF